MRDLTGTVLGGPDPVIADDWDTQILLENIADSAEYKRRHERYDPAFSYDVAWSADSQWVAIEGGAHKFWHMAAYHLEHGRFRHIDLSHQALRIGEFFSSLLAMPNVPDLGADLKAKAVFHRNYDPACVTWIKNGMFAVNGYPYLLNDPHFGKVREHYVMSISSWIARISLTCR